MLEFERLEDDLLLSTECPKILIRKLMLLYVFNNRDGFHYYLLPVSIICWSVGLLYHYLSSLLEHMGLENDVAYKVLCLQTNAEWTLTNSWYLTVYVLRHRTGKAYLHRMCYNRNTNMPPKYIGICKGSDYFQGRTFLFFSDLFVLAKYNCYIFRPLNVVASWGSGICSRVLPVKG